MSLMTMTLHSTRDMHRRSVRLLTSFTGYVSLPYRLLRQTNLSRQSNLSYQSKSPC